MGEIVGYTRVSTDQQAYKTSLRQHVARLQASGATKVYCDIASRTTDDRSSLNDLLEEVKLGKISQVLITRLDRLTASPGLFEKVTKIFQSYGVELIALDEHVDVHSVDGQFTANLQVIFAHREVNTIRQRVKKGYEHIRKNQRANVQCPWGYRVENGKYKLDHTPFLCLLEDKPEDGSEFPGRTKVELSKDLIEMFFAGGSLSATAKALHERYGIQKFISKIPPKQNALVVDADDFEFEQKRNTRVPFRWSRDGIRNWLKNPVLRGHTPYGTSTSNASGGKKNLPQSEWDIRYNTHPDQALLTEAQFEEIKLQIEQNYKYKGYGRPEKRKLLTGKLFCADCGRVFKIQGVKYPKGQKVYYYQCNNYQERACGNKAMIRDVVAEAAIIEKLTQAAEAIADFAQSQVEETPIDSPELQQLNQQLEGLKALGKNPAIEAAKTDLEVQINKLKSELRQQQIRNIAARDELVAAFKNPRCWQNLSSDEKEKTLTLLVSKVFVKDGKVINIELKI